MFFPTGDNLARAAFFRARQFAMESKILEANTIETNLSLSLRLICHFFPFDAGPYACSMYVCMHACMYVCMYVCTVSRIPE